MKKLLFALLISLSFGNAVVAAERSDTLLRELVGQLDELQSEELVDVVEKTTFQKVVGIPAAFVKIVKKHPKFVIGAATVLGSGVVYQVAVNKLGKKDVGVFETKEQEKVFEVKDGKITKEVQEKIAGFIKDHEGATQEDIKDEKVRVTWFKPVMIDATQFKTFEVKDGVAVDKEGFDAFEKDCKWNGLEKNEIKDDKEVVTGFEFTGIIKEQKTEKALRSWAKPGLTPKGLVIDKGWNNGYFVGAREKVAAGAITSKDYTYDALWTNRNKYSRTGEGAFVTAGTAATIVLLYRYIKKHNPELINKIAGIVDLRLIEA